MSEQYTTKNMPILALRGLVIFPEQTVHFDVGRLKSALALEAAMKKDQYLFLVPQKDIVEDDPSPLGLYPVGTVVRVKQVLKSHGENIRVLVTGIYRARIQEMLQTEPYLSGVIEPVLQMPGSQKLRARALCREANMLYASYLDMVEYPAQSAQLKVMASSDCGFIADTIAQYSGMDYRDKAKILCQLNPERRLENLITIMHQEVQMLQLESDIQEKTKTIIDQEQRDYYLREQMKAIREELGESDEKSEFWEYEKNILALHLDKDVENKLLKDLDRLKTSPLGRRKRQCCAIIWIQCLSFPGTKRQRKG